VLGFVRALSSVVTVLPSFFFTASKRAASLRGVDAGWCVCERERERERERKRKRKREKE
jgi:hypothetical protein